MIGQQQKGKKQAGADKLSGVQAISRVKKIRAADGSYMTIDPKLDKFSGDEYLPEKHKEAENRLANSVLPPFK